MPYSAKIIKDSICCETGVRLVTMELTYPRFVHSEFMTHRVFSRNAASSRAIPVQKMLDRVKSDPVIPVWWGKNQSGMQAKVELDDRSKDLALKEWLYARDMAVLAAESMVALSVHKQIVNRILEPFSWITVIVTATEWNNFFHLRCHPDAQPEIQKIAYMACELYHEAVPTECKVGDWHLPYISEDDIRELKDKLDLSAFSLTVEAKLKMISVARCARVSYLTHDGKRDHSEDLRLYERLMEGSGGGHWSPFEHVAEALPDGNTQSGNFFGWRQYRKFFSAENKKTYSYNPTWKETRAV